MSILNKYIFVYITSEARKGILDKNLQNLHQLNCLTYSLNQGWLTIQKPRAIFLTVFLQRATLYTRCNDRMNITPPLTQTN